MALMQKPNNDKPTIRAWSMWLLSILFYFYIMLLQVSTSVMVHDLMHDFSVTATAIGSLVGIYFYVYAGMQIPVGILLDKWGTRSILILSAFTCALGCLLFATSHEFATLEIARTLISLGSATVTISTIYIVSSFFDVRYFPVLLGLQLTTGMLGAFTGQAPLSFMVASLGWRLTLTIFGIIGLIFVVLFFFVLEKKRAPKFLHETPTKLIEGLRFVCSHKLIWIAAIYASLMYAPTMAFGSLWGTPFFIQVAHFAKSKAAMLASMVFVGWMVGAPAWGVIYQKLGQLKKLLIVGTLLTLSSILATIYLTNSSEIALMVYLFIFGFASSSMLLAYSFARQMAPLKYNGSTMGFMNMFNMIIGATLAPLIGMMLDYYWKGEIINHVRIYSTHNYHIAMFLIPLTVIIAAILLFFLKTNKNIP